MESVLAKVKQCHVRAEPFPHIHVDESLSAQYYQELSDSFPEYSFLWATGGEHLRECLRSNNSVVRFPGICALRAELFPPIWKDFMAFHLSDAFYRQVIGFMGDHIRRCYPDIESRLGKPLDQLTVAPRGTGVDADVLIDCQFVINTPVVKPSRVLGVHVDLPDKLYSAMLYMRLAEDDSVGGDLRLYRFLGEQRYFEEKGVRDSLVEVVDTVHYKANNLILFINSPTALHGVTERGVTPHVRRYINFLAQLRHPLFDLSPYQETADE